MLAKDEPLPQRYFDHPLSGEWNDHRDCPDLVLIYRKPDATGLELVPAHRHVINIAELIILATTARIPR